MEQYLHGITKALADLELDNLEPLVKQALDAGEKASSILEAMSAGMVKVGELFEQGQYFFPSAFINETSNEAFRLCQFQRLFQWVQSLFILSLLLQHQSLKNQVFNHVQNCSSISA